MTNLLLKTAGAAAKRLPPSIRNRLYRLGPISHWIRLALNRAAPEGLTEVEVASGAIAGLKLKLDLQREKDCWLGNYETNLQQAVQTFIKTGMTVYDIGANIGYVSLVLASAVGESGHVYSFEALPDNIERLKNHISLNRFEERITVTHAAVVNRPGKQVFLVHDSHGMGKAAGSAGRKETYTEEIEVDGIDIDTFVFEHENTPPAVVKMDIEGGEVMALPGMAKTIAKYRPIIFIELHGEKAAEAAWSSFPESEYSLHHMDTDFTEIHSLDEIDWKAYLIALPRKTA